MNAKQSSAAKVGGAGEKKSARMNFFDVLLIILALLILLGGAALLIFRKTASADTTPVEYTVLVKREPSEMNVMIHPGDVVVDTIKLGELGHVVSSYTKPSEYEMTNLTEGTIVEGTYDDYMDIVVTIEADAAKTDGVYHVGTLKLAVGGYVYFRTPYFTGYGYITEVKVP